MKSARQSLEDALNLSTCSQLFKAVVNCQSVSEVSLAMSMHIAECPRCAALRPEPPKVKPAYVQLPDGTCHFPNRKKAA